jgi:hypothetical protein
MWTTLVLTGLRRGEDGGGSSSSTKFVRLFWWGGNNSNLGNMSWPDTLSPLFHGFPFRDGRPWELRKSQTS